MLTQQRVDCLLEVFYFPKEKVNAELLFHFLHRLEELRRLSPFRLCATHVEELLQVYTYKIKEIEATLRSL